MKRKALKEIKNSKIDIWYVCEKEVTVLKEVGNFIKIKTGIFFSKWVYKKSIGVRYTII